MKIMIRHFTRWKEKQFADVWYMYLRNMLFWKKFDEVFVTYPVSQGLHTNAELYLYCLYE